MPADRQESAVARGHFCGSHLYRDGRDERLILASVPPSLGRQSGPRFKTNREQIVDQTANGQCYIALRRSSSSRREPTLPIRAVYIRRFRSIEAAALSPCGNLNTLIGKNNAGKSNLLSAIELALAQLRSGRLAAPWRAHRAQEQFNDRDTTSPLRVAIEFDLSAEVSEGIRQRLAKEAPNLERSIEQIATHKSVSFIVAATMDDGRAFTYVEQIYVGSLRGEDQDILVDGIRLLSLTRPVALELYQNFQAAESLAKGTEYLEELRSEQAAPLRYVFEQPKEARTRSLLAYARRSTPTDPLLLAELEDRLNSATTIEEFKNSISELSGQIKARIEAVEKRETAGAISAYAGETKLPPTYATWLMKEFGKLSVLHLRETRRQIGREEAKTLLDLKVTRGGPQRLVMIQQTVRGLMGVNLDAFQAEARGEASAEMDVDEFLVEANGAGIKEALRIILDLELQAPSLALIEEPEVHLHPGLARVLATYLREKSRTIQIFITTHSTDFVDFVSFQNVFLVSRNLDNKTICDGIGPDDASFRIPAELGLRLSTVFMFDRLVFVEGPSDEAVLREFARKLNADFTKSNVGFVYMRGARNFAHFAAEATLEMLARRHIRMWFILDRDENEDADVRRMAERLGDRATLVVLKRREIENYLLETPALASYIDEKLTSAGSNRRRPTPEEIAPVVQSTAAGLRDEVIRLRTEKRLLKPIFLHTRAVSGSIEERIQSARSDLEGRLSGIGEQRRLITEDVDQNWAEHCDRIAPGSTILEKTSAHFGAPFSKEKGDSERIARYVRADAIPYELDSLIREIARE